jgi:hypothetical protein
MSKQSRRQLRFWVRAVAVLATGCWGTGWASGDTIYVCWDGSGDYLSIQDGIDAAVDGDVVIVCDGIYIGDKNKNLDFSHGLEPGETRAITVRSENGPYACTIDCEDEGRGFYFHSGENEAAVLEGFTVTNGNAKEVILDPNKGGAILCSDSSPTIADCLFVENSVVIDGGAVYCHSSSPTVRNCTFRENTAYFKGGGMYNENGSSPVVEYCTFRRNRCGFSGTGESGGGGMCNNASSPTVSHCSFLDNITGHGAVFRSPHDGGGMCNMAGSHPLVEHCVFDRNSAVQGNGGGLGNRGGSNPQVSYCVFKDNWSEPAGWPEEGNGGGMSNTASTPTVMNCIFTGNVAVEGSGGAIADRGGSSPWITFCTLNGNEVEGEGDGGGIYNESSNDSPTVTNCILWGNIPDELSGGGNPVVTYCDVQGGWPGATNINADPLFCNPEQGDYYLQENSPCIDEGTNDVPGRW